MKDKRTTPIEISKDDFKKIGYQLIDTISDFINTIDEKPVTTGEFPEQLQKILGSSSLTEDSIPAKKILLKASELLLNHSLLNGHPKFLGYITSSAAPLGALADLLAAAVNPNVGAQILSPIATEIERQTIKWLAEFIGVSQTYGGIFVSGGNMANFTAFLAARTAKAAKHIKEDGLSGVGEKLTIYCSKSTHTWIEKAAILFGHGSKAIRWIPVDTENKMDTKVLKITIHNDIENNYTPLMVIGNAGDVSCGAVDDLNAIAEICKMYNLWFHIDGAYGIPAAVIPKLKNIFQGINEADSIAIDPHKWLYSPLEAGCTLVKNPRHLTDTFSSHPEYYNFSKNKCELTLNYYEYGLQNSRGFRALKVWMILQQVGRSGYIKLIEEDIELSKLMYTLALNHSELEGISQNLSITNLRYVPIDLRNDSEKKEKYLNILNEALLDHLQQSGEVFLSNAIIMGKYCLRGCIVNFRTSQKDIVDIINLIVQEGRKIHKKLHVS